MPLQPTPQPKYCGQALFLMNITAAILLSPAALATPRTDSEPHSSPSINSSPIPQPRDWWETSPPSSPSSTERPFLLEQWGERDRQNQQHQNLQNSLQQQQQQDRDRYEQRQRDWQLQQQRDLQR